MLRPFRARRELAKLRDDLRRTLITVATADGHVIVGPMDLHHLMLISKYGGLFRGNGARAGRDRRRRVRRAIARRR